MKIGLLTDTHYGFSKKHDEILLSRLKPLVEEGPDLMVHCGDYGSNCYQNREDFWKLMRSLFPAIPILTVHGNHDYWQVNLGKDKRQETVYPKPHSPKEILDMNSSILNKYDITHLIGGFSLSGVFFMGFDGWYRDDVYTNDRRHVPHYVLPEGRNWLVNKSVNDFEHCIKKLKASEEKTKILVSHFGFIEKALDYDINSGKEYYGANLNYEDFIQDANYFLFGHSHIPYNGKSRNGFTNCINIGSGYDNPDYGLLMI